eukprot:g620.t1
MNLFVFLITEVFFLFSTSLSLRVNSPRDETSTAIMNTPWLARMADKAQLDHDSAIEKFDLIYPCRKDSALLQRMPGLTASAFQGLVTSSSTDAELEKALKEKFPNGIQAETNTVEEGDSNLTSGSNAKKKTSYVFERQKNPKDLSSHTRRTMEAEKISKEENSITANKKAPTSVHTFETSQTEKEESLKNDHC